MGRLEPEPPEPPSEADCRLAYAILERLWENNVLHLESSVAGFYVRQGRYTHIALDPEQAHLLTLLTLAKKR